MTLVRLEHARALGYCNRGVRTFCARHGLDFSRLRTDGLPLADFQGIDDAMLRRVIKEAQRREQ